MKPIETKYSQTGIQLIDLHHKKLENLLVVLEKALEYDDNQAELTSIFLRFSYKLENYFTDEEMLFAKYNYPEFLKHKLAHNAFIKQVQYIQQSFISGNTTAGKDLYTYLLDWYNLHIRKYDIKAAKFLKSVEAKV